MCFLRRILRRHAKRFTDTHCQHVEEGFQHVLVSTLSALSTCTFSSSSSSSSYYYYLKWQILIFCDAWDIDVTECNSTTSPYHTSWKVKHLRNVCTIHFAKRLFPQRFQIVGESLAYFFPATQNRIINVKRKKEKSREEMRTFSSLSLPPPPPLSEVSCEVNIFHKTQKKKIPRKNRLLIWCFLFFLLFKFTRNTLFIFFFRKPKKPKDAGYIYYPKILFYFTDKGNIRF